MDTSKDELIRIGDEYAYQMLLERNAPGDGVPDVFLSTLPGSYFEEYIRFQEMERKIKLNKPLKLKSTSTNLKSVEIRDDGATLFVKEPVLVGTDDWTVLMTFLENRAEEGGAESTLKVAIMPNKDIWALPYRLSENAKGKKEMTQHSISASGNPCVWAGEVDIKNAILSEMRGDSGHFRTYGIGPRQRGIFEFAKSAFQAQGYTTEGIYDKSKAGQKKSSTGWTSMSS